MFTPCLLIREPELIKNIVIKDFKHFQNNEIYLEKETDRIFGRHPFCLKGMEWRTKRAQLTTCFTSGKVQIFKFYTYNLIFWLLLEQFTIIPNVSSINCAAFQAQVFSSAVFLKMTVWNQGMAVALRKVRKDLFILFASGVRDAAPNGKTRSYLTMDNDLADF